MNMIKTCVMVLAVVLPLAANAKDDAKILTVETVQFVSSAEHGSSISQSEEEEEEEGEALDVSKSKGNTVQQSQPFDWFKKQAVVLAKRTTLLRGEKFMADIVMLNPNPNCKYTVYVGDVELSGGKYVVVRGSVGNYSFSGYIEEKDSKGQTTQYPFSAEYQVSEPTATISNLGMDDVLYAGYTNHVDVFAPGIESSNLMVSVTNANFVKKVKGFTVIPTMPGRDCLVNVSENLGSSTKRYIGRKSFRVLPLPAPLAYLKVGDQTFGGGVITKKLLTECTEVVALLDSDLLPGVKYKVLNFDMKFYQNGKMVVLHSNTGKLTEQMLQAIKQFADGEIFFVSGVKVKAQDGKLHKLPTLEAQVKVGEQ